MSLRRAIEPMDEWKPMTAVRPTIGRVQLTLPMHRTFAALDAERQAAFTEDIVTLMATGNRATDGTLVLPSAYLEAVIERAW